jgi:exopolyphosphatase/guanosine-5'-triphosphate,3'-diphosphate pyrophosphatase
MKGLQRKYGLIDLGSNTIRLVIYKYEKAGRFKEIGNIKVVARLRNYLNDDNILTEEGLKVMIETLKSFEEVTQFHGVTNVQGVATAAVRQATNQAEILDAISQFTSFPFRILSEREEAYYGFNAVVNSTSIQEGITIDIGGGSTEITYFKDRKMQHFHSFPFGAISLTKQFVKNKIPTVTELKKLTSYLKEQFQSLPWLPDRKLSIIGIGGSARNLAQIDQAMKQYPLGGLHHYEMNDDDINAVINRLIELPFEKLQKVEGLSKDRADIIIPAFEVFKVLYDVVQASQYILSRKGLRDGIFYEQMLDPLDLTTFPNVLEESMFELGYDYEMKVKEMENLRNVAELLFKELRSIKAIELTGTDLFDLRCAAKLFHLGAYIDSESNSQHTFYLLANRTIDGIDHRDRLKLALLASYKSKSVFKQFIKPFDAWFNEKQVHKLLLLGSILKFANSLNYTKRNIVKEIKLNSSSAEITVDIYCNSDSRFEQYQTEKQKKHLEKALNQSIQLNFHRAN